MTVVERGSSGEISYFVWLLSEVAISGGILACVDADDSEYPRHTVFSISYGRIYTKSFPKRVCMIFKGKNVK